MSDENKQREFWMDRDLSDKALYACDLGDGYTAKVRQYPHADMLPELVHVIEYAAYEQLQRRLTDQIHTLHNVIDHGLPGAMFEGSHEWKLWQELNQLQLELQAAKELIAKLSKNVDTL